MDSPHTSVNTKIMFMAMEQYDSLKWRIPDDFLSYDHFKRVVMDLDMTSSPGYPLMRSYTTNKLLFGYDEGTLNEGRCADVWERVQERIRNRSPADLIRLFIKAEPHKVAKIEKGRYRLISSVSVVDQIIDHMLFQPMNDKFIENWDIVPPKVGWSPVKGGWRMMPSNLDWVATDKSAWDWSAQMWLFENCLALRAALCENMTDEWLDLAIYRYKQLYEGCKFVTSDGAVLQQRRRGIQKSGCVNTITDNSLMQWFLHVRVCHENGFAVTPMYSMGDDVLQENFPNFSSYLEKIAEYCNIKGSAINRCEFAGFRFGQTIEPLYKGKHAFNLLHAIDDVLPDLALSYTILYHRSRDRDFMRSMFRDMNLNIFPLPIIDLIFDGDE